MTERNFDAIAFLFDLVQPMLTEFDDYRIDGALKAAKEQHAAALTDSAMFDLLCESFDAWNGEEVSVKAADPVKAALLDCIGALSASMDQIHQMRGMFDDADGTIQDALDAAEDAQAKAREALA
jgi:hypothetical protein